MKHKIKFTCGCRETKFFWCLNEIHDFVEFKQSTLPEAGVGLFAKKDIPNNTALSWYKGHLIDPNSRSFKPSYCWNFTSDLTNERKKLEALIDHVGNPLAYVNTFANDEQKKLLNVKRLINNDRIYYITIRKIKAGEEIIVDYESKKYRKQLNERIKANRTKK